MRRLMTATVLGAFTCLGLLAADAWANQGFPPKNLPDGAGWLPGPNQIVTLGSMLQARPYERPRTGPFTLSKPSPSGKKATPMPLPGPRSIKTLRPGTLKLSPQPLTLPNPSRLRLMPRPSATPIPLP
ncbi:MAG: hypothetical protein MUE50_03725 [Pirellulaceae bacterium]|jgi:hypothetical protein|nr:hypothetical protein [Pirellulaceae bacterium]